MSEAMLQRDERGRPIAGDGYPLGGNATVAETSAAGSLSESKVYLMIQAGELAAVRYGRSVRIPWQEVRRMFLQTSGDL